MFLYRRGKGLVGVPEEEQSTICSACREFLALFKLVPAWLDFIYIKCVASRNVALFCVIESFMDAALVLKSVQSCSTFQLAGIVLDLF